MTDQYRNVKTGEFVDERDIESLVRGGAVIEIVEPEPEPDFSGVTPQPYSELEEEFAVEV